MSYTKFTLFYKSGYTIISTLLVATLDFKSLICLEIFVFFYNFILLYLSALFLLLSSLLLDKLLLFCNLDIPNKVDIAY